MSGPELPYSAACIRRITKLCLDLLEINQRTIKIVDYLRELHFGLNKPTSKETVASSDLAPDTLSGLYSGGRGNRSRLLCTLQPSAGSNNASKFQASNLTSGSACL